jgi:TfoX/Sxy family transcriptional regulator of competence genes
VPCHNGFVGAVERELRDRAADALVEVEHLEVRALFSGFGFYVDGTLTAAAWDGRFRLRYHEGGRWRYHAVADDLLDDPAVLVPLIRDRAAELSKDSEARPRRRGARRQRP